MSFWCHLTHTTTEFHKLFAFSTKINRSENLDPKMMYTVIPTPRHFTIRELRVN